MDNVNDNDNAVTGDGEPSQFDLRDCIEYHVNQATYVLRGQLAEANAKITPTGYVLVEVGELDRLRRSAENLQRVQEACGALILPDGR